MCERGRETEFNKPKSKTEKIELRRKRNRTQSSILFQLSVKSVAKSGIVRVKNLILILFFLLFWLFIKIHFKFQLCEVKTWREHNEEKRKKSQRDFGLWRKSFYFIFCKSERRRISIANCFEIILVFNYFRWKSFRNETKRRKSDFSILFSLRDSSHLMWQC